MSLPVRTRRTVGDSYAGHDTGNVDRADDENEGIHPVSSFHGLGGLVSRDSLFLACFLDLPNSTKSTTPIYSFSSR